MFKKKIKIFSQKKSSTAMTHFLPILICKCWQNLKAGVISIFKSSTAMLCYAEIKFKIVMGLERANQNVSFQNGVDMLLYNLFMTLDPRFIRSKLIKISQHRHRHRESMLHSTEQNKIKLLFISDDFPLAD